MNGSLGSSAKRNYTKMGSIEEVDYTEMKSGEPSFLKALVRGFGGYYALAGVFKFFYDCLTFVNPQILRYSKYSNGD